MSGGHFQYEQYKIGQIADEVEQLILSNEDETPEPWGRERKGYFFTAETIAEFKKGLLVLRAAQVYAQRIDWLVSGDDGEEQFCKRLAADLAKIVAGDTGGEARNERTS